MKLQLPSTVSSLQDLAVLELEVRGYAKWFAANAIKERVHAKNATPPPRLSEGALELVRTASGKKLLSASQLDELIEALDAAKNAPTVTITLAAPATADVKKQLVAAVRQHVDGEALVSFKFNASLLGGMVVSYGSHVLDWSFRRQILNNRGHFMETLRNV